MTRDVNIYPREETRAVLQRKIELIGEHSQSLAPQGSAKAREEKLVQDSRKRLLRRIDKELVGATTPENSIFISYSGVGKGLGEVAAKLAQEYGFMPKTGFDAEVELRMSRATGVEESLPQAIISQIVSCDCFLGIWTEDFSAENKEGTDMRGNKLERQTGYIPSVWMPFELGIAASHNVPFRLLVSSGTHRLYYEKPFNLQAQILFERHEFETRCRRVLEHMLSKVRAKRRGGIYR